MRQVDRAFLDLLRRDDDDDDGAARELLEYCTHYARYYTGNEDEADDAAQDAVCKLRSRFRKKNNPFSVKKTHGKDEDESFRGYVKKTVRSCISDSRRKQREILFDSLSSILGLNAEEQLAAMTSDRDLDEHVVSGSYTLHTFNNDIETQVHFKEILGILARTTNSRKRRLVFLKYVLEYKIHEIATMLNCPPSRVNTWIDRARKECQAKLRQAGITSYHG